LASIILFHHFTDTTIMILNHLLARDASKTKFKNRYIHQHKHTKYDRCSIPYYWTNAKTLIDFLLKKLIFAND